VDPRYRFKNRTIIELLEITAEEEQEMRTIISDNERRRRDRQRKNPEMTRKEYEDRAAMRREEARRLAAKGLSLREIGKRLGISHEAVRKALR
jgi:DNA-binding NarL/FixJ family response regulator